MCVRVCVLQTERVCERGRVCVCVCEREGEREIQNCTISQNCESHFS